MLSPVIIRTIFSCFIFFTLVNINVGVAMSIQKVNLTIADVDAELQLIVRLGHLVEIVNRVFQAPDLNPLLINTLNSVTSALDSVVWCGRRVTGLNDTRWDSAVIPGRQSREYRAAGR
ncbi:hypothetical protein GJ744_007200 [Endocarpon pusillum]|uniref:Uncharacterized protein n=1 Tax=Endocarpon pusillum TaxID=364733 RepID=A0A8H7ANA3_9EURO|nr:hypothetical protein GJ744_007200 [Endocarpon pusillum]